MTSPARARLTGRRSLTTLPVKSAPHGVREIHAMNSARPFDGIRVAEFGQFISVPFCG